MNTPFILHIPHSSTFIPEEYLCGFCSVNLKKELNLMTDRFTDELFDLPFPRLVFPVSRLVCDVERFRDDEKEMMSKKGMGVCYTKCHDGKLLRHLTPDEKNRIITGWYDRHHRKFTEMTGQCLEKHGGCLIVDCHSFSPFPLKYEPVQKRNRPDICIGTDDYHTPAEIRDYLLDSFSDLGYDVGLNTPYAGAIVPIDYYRKDRRVKSVMIEINRSLYMNRNCEKVPTFSRIKKDIKSVIIKMPETIGR